MSLQGGPSTPAPANPGPVPPTQPATILAGDTPRRPKIKEPDTFRGERFKLREWLAQMKVYFRLVGWAEGHDAEKIVYTSAKIYFTSDALAPRPDVSDAISCVPCVPRILT